MNFGQSLAIYAKKLEKAGFTENVLYQKILLYFDGVPYLWGGENELGCDCSGSVCAALSFSTNNFLRETADYLFTNIFTTTLSDSADLDKEEYVAIFFLNEKKRAIHVAGYCDNGFFMNVSQLEPGKKGNKRTLQELTRIYSKYRYYVRKRSIKTNEYV